MRPEMTAQDDVNTLCDFAIQVRTLCAQLVDNPFNTPAAEELLDVLIDDAAAADLALARVLRTVICKPASSGTHILRAIAQCCCTPKATPVVCAAA
ncbi:MULTISPECIES: hypothetical protein [Mycolicibacterium]|uniref:Uncharacterized protein n=1 Tax=Mycolicibacterium arenosum TaxID=2952157 RepID=A0ABT1MCH6_9MYCO|nr:hypothetical protein [Mycolicibacterium sp. CAU 1645]MCP9276577.1 hypothetical protein [Mycolicibacterium sp. CAU 1645]